MRFGIYVKAAGTAAVRIATVSVALSINRISYGAGIKSAVILHQGLTGSDDREDAKKMRAN